MRTRRDRQLRGHKGCVSVRPIGPVVAARRPCASPPAYCTPSVGDEPPPDVDGGGKKGRTVGGGDSGGREERASAWIVSSSDSRFARGAAAGGEACIGQRTACGQTERPQPKWGRG